MGNVSSTVSSDADFDGNSDSDADCPQLTKAEQRQRKDRAKSGDSDGASRLFIHSLRRIAQECSEKGLER